MYFFPVFRTASMILRMPSRLIAIGTVQAQCLHASNT